jgi:hypothetical protein
MTPLIDPCLGDVEDDASSTKRRSLLAMAGTILAEVSLPKLIVSWVLLILLPAMLLGLTPLIVSGWLATFSRKVAALFSGSWAVSLLLVVVVLGWIGGRPLLRAAEQGFWSLNSVVVQPGYALCRECLRHLMERLVLRNGAANPTRLRSATAAGAGLILCGVGLGVVVLAWPASRWVGTIEDLASPQRLLVPALANAAVLLGGYLAAAALLWGIADAAMPQPRDLLEFDQTPADGRISRVVHLSDLHIVGERYGFRIESGRSGPRGNGRLIEVLERLEHEHKRRPFDIILVTGDVTDAGRSSEWAEFLGALSKYPQLSRRMLILPGNHDVNVVDRANPARLDLPTSPGRRLRQLRALSAMAAVQGGKVRVVDPETRDLRDTLDDALAPHRSGMVGFADTGSLRLSMELAQVWSDAFPMVMPPVTEDGLGVMLLNSTAETHFSFTNALGLVSSSQARALQAIAGRYPMAYWIVALHHHLVEYPKLGSALSERIGTALINGSWFSRQLQPLGRRVVVMHGHRHIDWIGTCGSLRIISAPSPVMEATDDIPTSFLVHRLVAGPAGRLGLLAPERIEIAGSAAMAVSAVP